MALWNPSQSYTTALLLDEVDAFDLAMVCSLWRRDHGARRYVDVMGEGKCLTYNTSYILPEGDDVDDHVSGDRVEAGAVQHTEHRNMH